MRAPPWCRRRRWRRHVTRGAHRPPRSPPQRAGGSTVPAPPCPGGAGRRRRERSGKSSEREERRGGSSMVQVRVPGGRQRPRASRASRLVRRLAGAGASGPGPYWRGSEGSAGHPISHWLGGSGRPSPLAGGAQRCSRPVVHRCCPTFPPVCCGRGTLRAHWLEGPGPQLSLAGREQGPAPTPHPLWGRHGGRVWAVAGEDWWCWGSLVGRLQPQG